MLCRRVGGAFERRAMEVKNTLQVMLIWWNLMNVWLWFIENAAQRLSWVGKSFLMFYHLNWIFITNCWELFRSRPLNYFMLWGKWKIPRARDSQPPNESIKNLINSLRKQEKAAIFNIEKFMDDGSICDDGSRKSWQEGNDHKLRRGLIYWRT